MNTRRQLLRCASVTSASAIASALLGACASGQRAEPAQAARGSSELPPQAMSNARVMASPQALARANHLMHRLGYGPRPGDLERVLLIGERAFIAQQLRSSAIAMPEALQAELDALTTFRMPLAESITEYQNNVMQLAQTASQQTSLPQLTRENRRQIIREVAQDVSRNRLLRAIDSPRQLEEVMVEFWYNHFNVFIGKGLDRVLVGHYEQQAIRPHVFGRFRDLLGATAKHPAMLFYLDNAQSVAAGTGAGARRGLNENYARELMELHTLGVDGGYRQTDVTELARILTGWTFDRTDTSGNAFRFDARRHDNQIKQWLGHRVEPNGVGEGEWALDQLAAHPATARHISYKLAQYFVADQPPQSLVAQLTARFSATQGNIREVLEQLFASEEFWNVERRKFKTPFYYVVSCVRAAGISLPPNVASLANQLSQMGMPMYGCPTPDGYKNTEAAWLNPEAMTRRLNFATAIASGRLALNRTTNIAQAAQDGRAASDRILSSGRPDSMPPLDWIALLSTLEPTIKPTTREIIQNSAAPLRAALVLGSPEFMRR